MSPKDEGSLISKFQIRKRYQKLIFDKEFIFEIKIETIEGRWKNTFNNHYSWKIGSKQVD